jgi:hypothetical protein
MSDDGLPDGPYCPTCSGELEREAIATDSAIVVAFVCPVHGVSAVAPPFE